MCLAATSCKPLITGVQLRNAGDMVECKLPAIVPNTSTIESKPTATAGWKQAVLCKPHSSLASMACACHAYQEISALLDAAPGVPLKPKLRSHVRPCAPAVTAASAVNPHNRIVLSSGTVDVEFSQMSARAGEPTALKGLAAPDGRNILALSLTGNLRIAARQKSKAA